MYKLKKKRYPFLNFLKYVIYLTPLRFSVRRRLNFVSGAIIVYNLWNVHEEFFTVRKKERLVQEYRESINASARNKSMQFVRSLLDAFVFG